MTRRVIPVGLAVVSGCAVALSFASLYDLARLCGFGVVLAALVPVLADAGAAVATAVWLGGDAPRRARGFARALALVLLGASVVGNAVGHALVAYGARPHWTVVVLVGALAPAVLAAVVHLAALVGLPGPALPDDPGAAAGEEWESDLAPPPDWWATAPPAAPSAVAVLTAARSRAGVAPVALAGGGGHLAEAGDVLAPDAPRSASLADGAPAPASAAPGELADDAPAPGELADRLAGRDDPPIRSG
jgi:hypothetical protein